VKEKKSERQVWSKNEEAKKPAFVSGGSGDQFEILISDKDQEKINRRRQMEEKKKEEELEKNYDEYQ